MSRGERAYFGPAGNENGFYEKGYKKTLEAPLYLGELGLDAYEYQCGRGVKVSRETAQLMKKAALENGIKLSLHAPYYISLSGLDERVRMGSVGYILQSAEAAEAMGADRIVVHSGSCGKQTREAALALAKDTMKAALAALEQRGLGDIVVCPETMGKINQLGTLGEVLELCSLDERMIPCIDFGHLNARTRGGIKGYADYEEIIKRCFGSIGEDRTKIVHCHFSKIEYTDGGEKKHLTFEDGLFGPEFEPLAEAFYKYGVKPTVICESDGTQARDALSMKNMFERICAAV